jgi:hypothetical protein
MVYTLGQIEAAVRESWSADTCDVVDLPWSESNPSRGQCGVTALVLHDLLGGDLLIAEVLNADGSRQGHHTWNRLAGGIEVDLTREQFRSDEVVQAPRVVSRPAGPPVRCVEQYDEMRRRVGEALRG